MKSNGKVPDVRMNALANDDTRILTSRMRLALLLLVASIYVLGNLQPAVGDRRGGEEGSGVGGTGILDLPGSGLGGSGMRPYLGIVSPQETVLDGLDKQLAAGGFDQGPANEVIVLRDASFPRNTPQNSEITEEVKIKRVLDNPVSSVRSTTQQTPQSPTHTATQPAITRNDGSTGRRIEGFLQSDLSSLTTDGSIESASSISILESIENGTQQINALLAISASELGMPEAEINETEIEPAAVQWADIVNWLNANASAEQEKAVEKPTAIPKATRDNLAIAEITRASGLRRPQLPSLQRARPLQRATILPPRVRPLGL